MPANPYKNCCLKRIGLIEDKTNKLIPHNANAGSNRRKSILWIEKDLAKCIQIKAWKLQMNHGIVSV